MTCRRRRRAAWTAQNVSVSSATSKTRTTSVLCATLVARTTLTPTIEPATTSRTSCRRSDRTGASAGGRRRTGVSRCRSSWTSKPSSTSPISSCASRRSGRPPCSSNGRTTSARRGRSIATSPTTAPDRFPASQKYPACRSVAFRTWSVRRATQTWRHLPRARLVIVGCNSVYNWGLKPKNRPGRPYKKVVKKTINSGKKINVPSCI